MLENRMGFVISSSLITDEVKAIESSSTSSVVRVARQDVLPCRRRQKSNMLSHVGNRVSQTSPSHSRLVGLLYETSCTSTESNAVE